jgi:capsular exopolysaccharide synthesis family protein
MINDNFEKRLIKKLKNLSLIYWRRALLLVLVACLGTVINHVLFPVYTAVSVLHVRTMEESPLLSVIGKVSGFQWSQIPQESPARKFIKVLQSENFQRFIQVSIAQQGLDDPMWKDIQMPTVEDSGEEGQVQALAKLIFYSVGFKADEDFIEIQAKSSTAEDAVLIANVVMQLSFQYISHYERKDIEDAEKYLREQQELVQNRVLAMTDEINGLREGSLNGMGDDNFLAKSYSRLQEDEQNLKYKLEETNRLLRKFVIYAKQGSANGKSQAKSSPDKPDERLPSSTDEIQAEELAGEVGRGRLADKIRQLLDEKDIYQVRLAAIRDQKNELTQSSHPKKEQRIFELKKKIDLEHFFSQRLQQQLFDNRIYQISIDNRIRPYSQAHIKSAGPASTLFYKLFVVSLMILVISAFLMIVWEKIFPVITDKEHLIELGVNFIGSIPDLKRFNLRTGGKGPRRKQNEQQSLIHEPNIRSPISTTFQFLGTRIVQNLMRKNEDRKGVVSIVSNRAGDGKSVISANLAVVMGTFGLKTLLIHGDWLKVESDNFLDTDHKEGLVEILAGKKIDPSYIHATKYKNVFYLGAGSKRQSIDLIDEEIFRNFVKEIRGHFDIVIVDTPPFEVGTEGLTLASFSDLCVVITRAFNTPIESLAEIVDILSIRGQTEIFGVINCADTQQSFSEAYAYTVAMDDMGDKKRA